MRGPKGIMRTYGVFGPLEWCNQIKVVIINLPVIMAELLFGIVLTISKWSYDVGPRVHFTAEFPVHNTTNNISETFSKCYKAIMFESSAESYYSK